MHLTVGYLATPTGDDGVTLASAAELPIRVLSLVSAENLAEAESVNELRQLQVAAAEDNLAVAARALPDAPEIESLVADGTTLESALKKLKWESADLLVVGSSRFAAPRRVSSARRRRASLPAPTRRSSSSRVTGIAFDHPSRRRCGHCTFARISAC